MPDPIPSKFLLHREFDNFDDLAAEYVKWNLDLRQLGCGRFVGEVLQVSTGRVLFGESRFSRSLLQQGAAPSGIRTFGIPASPTMSYQWRRMAVTGNDLLLFPHTGELHCVSSSNFHMFPMSFPVSLLEEVAELTEIGNLSELLKKEKFSCPASTMGHIRQKLHRVADAVKRRASLLASPAILNELEFEIPNLLLNAMSGGTPSNNHSSGRQRMQAVIRAENFIAQHEGDPLTVQKLCQETNVSERTLQYAFLDQYNITPKAYLKSLRLNGVRRDLRLACASVAKINQLAAHWGFWHMGQFAKDFRKQFGELPSETLRRDSLSAVGN